MGGVSKHLSHTWENLDMTFGQLKEILSEASEGTLEVVEKFDGCNLHFCVDSQGIPRFARNHTQRVEGGLNLRELKDFFEGHPAQETFVRGGIAICEMLKDQWWPLGFSRRNWVNCDVIDTKRPQLVHYDANAITLHEVSSFQSSGGKIPTSEVVQDQFSRLIESLPSSVAFDGEEFEILGPQTIETNHVAGTEIYDRVMDSIRSCQTLTNVEDIDTLREFAYRSIYTGVTSKINISEQKAKDLANLIVGYDSPTLVEIKKGLNTTVAKMVSSVGRSTVRGKIISEAVLPIETAISTLGSHLLDGVSSVLISNPVNECDRIKSEYVSARAVCENLDDGYQAQRLEIIEKHVRKIELENYSLESSIFSGFAIEGIVFERNGQKYKLTGHFAPVNQIDGITRYGRGKVPALSDSSTEKQYSILEGFSIG